MDIGRCKCPFSNDLALGVNPDMPFVAKVTLAVLRRALGVGIDLRAWLRLQFFPLFPAQRPIAALYDRRVHDRPFFQQQPVRFYPPWIYSSPSISNLKFQI